jgi:hypothetical protein
MILLSSPSAYNAWFDEWPSYQGITYDYWFSLHPSVYTAIGDNDND